MTKKKIIRKSNRTLNLFAIGGDTKQTWGQHAQTSAQSAFSGQNLGSTIGGIGSALGSIVNAGVQNAQLTDTSGLEEEIKAFQNYEISANNNDDLMSEWSAFSPMERVSWKDIRGGSTGQRIGNTLNAAGSGAAAGATVGGPIGAIVGGIVGLGSSIAGTIVGNKRAKEKTTTLNQYVKEANNRRLADLNNKASALDSQNDLIALANYSSYGGPLFTHGGIFSNGTTKINNGGTHEENPYEGVQIGVDNQGIPNLVEEGEVIYNNYVFSNRLSPSKNIKKLNKYKGNTFAEIASNLQKESEERPNDPISKRGLEDSMSKLQLYQEMVKSKNQNKKYSKGGHLFLNGGDKYDTTLLYGNSINVEDIFNKSQNDSEVNTNNKNKRATWLRYAPVVGSAIGLGYNIFNKPDYSDVDTLIDVSDQAGNYSPISYTPIGNYLTYKPFDVNYYANKLNAQSNATRRAILNNSSPSRNAVILATDYNTQTKLGDLFRQAEEFNLAQKERIEGFNRQTNMINSELGLKSAMANQEAELKANNQKMSGLFRALALKDTINNRRSNSVSTNLTTLFDSLGNIGKEEAYKGIIENIPSLLYNWRGDYKGKKSKGGYLTINKGRG